MQRRPDTRFGRKTSRLHSYPRVGLRVWWRAGFVAMSVSIPLVLGCCANRAVPAEDGYSPPLVVQVQGDWDDVDAAMDVALSEVEAAVESSQAVGLSKRYLIRTVRGEPGEVVLTQLETPGDIGLSVQIGRFGDRSREKRLADAIRSRLGALYGRDAAPLR